VEGYEAAPESENLQAAVATTAHAASLLESLAEAAKASDLAYGQAWFKYRSALPKVPPEIGAPSLAEWRVGLMSRGKNVTAKVEKLGQLTVQAKAYRSLSKKLAAGGERKKKEAAAAALKLEQKVLGLLNVGIVKNIRGAWNEHDFQERVTGLEEILKKPKVTKLEAGLAASRLADMQATGKTYKNQVRTMETVLTTGKKAFSAQELKANSKVFLKADGHVKLGKEIVGKVEVAVKEATGLVKAIQKKAG
jgi:hypothetical protein